MHVWHEIGAGGVNADVLILGGSNAHVGINPQILDRAFPGSKTYNLGLEGYAFDVQLSRYRFYLHHNTQPKLVILCSNYFEFERSQWSIDRGQFLPYCYDSTIRNALQELGVNRLKLSLPFLKYQGEANLVMAALGNKPPLPKDEEGVSESGYLPALLHWNEQTFERNARNPELFTPRADATVFHSFLNFLNECKAKGVTVVVAFTPHNTRYTSLVKGESVYRNMLKKAIDHKAQMIDFTGIPFWNDTALFYNGTHLNSQGADLFTRLLADSLRAKSFPSGAKK